MDRTGTAIYSCTTDDDMLNSSSYQYINSKSMSSTVKLAVQFLYGSKNCCYRLVIRSVSGRP